MAIKITKTRIGKVQAELLELVEQYPVWHKLPRQKTLVKLVEKLAEKGLLKVQAGYFTKAGN